MAIARIIFPFDLNGFRKEILPVLPQMREGNFHDLRNLARKIGENNKDVWYFLDYFGYRKDDLGREDIEFDNEVVKISFWINLILVSYCITYPRKTPNVREISELLPTLEVDPAIMSQLIEGWHIGGLLLSEIEMRPALLGGDKNWSFWCSHLGSWGWLANADLVELLYEFNQINMPFDEDRIKSLVDEIRVLLNWCIQRDLGLIVGISM
jgi:hypothetical protein